MYSVFSLICSSLITFLIVRLDHLHSHMSADHDLDGVQKVHAVPVPRIGGIGIFSGLVCTVLWLWFAQWKHRDFFLLFLVPSFFVFAVGLLEDLTKRVSVRMRLTVTMFAALIGSLLFNATVRTFGVPFIDTIFQINLVALLFTVVAVAGVANAVNLIDGFNGLSGFVCVTTLLALGAVAYMAGDQMIFIIALASAGAVAGFLVWNYPNAKIFLGDGGAYLVGFIIAELSVLVHERNPGVSVLFPLLLIIYPIFETLFSIYRRKFVRGQSPGAPDAMHLHQMINKRLVRWRVSYRIGDSIRSRGNAMTSPFLWILNLLAAVPAVIFWSNSLILAGFIALFAVSYLWVYTSIARFQTPRLLSLPLMHRSISRSIASEINLVEQNSKIYLAGIPVTCTTRKTLASTITLGNSPILVTANAQIITLLNTNSTLKGSTEDFQICLDGQIPVIAGRLLLRTKTIEKISGSDLIFELLDMARYGKFKKACLIGGSPDVADQFLARLSTKNIEAFAFTPIVSSDGTSDDIEHIAQKINEEKPEIVFIALGAPKQELFALQLRKRLIYELNLIFCCGGSVDFYVGKFNRSPRLLSTIGLEGIYRLVQEPSWKRLHRLFFSFRFFYYLAIGSFGTTRRR